MEDPDGIGRSTRQGTERRYRIASIKVGLDERTKVPTLDLKPVLRLADPFGGGGWVFVLRFGHQQHGASRASGGSRTSGDLATLPVAGHDQTFLLKDLQGGSDRVASDLELRREFQLAREVQSPIPVLDALTQHRGRLGDEGETAWDLRHGSGGVGSPDQKPGFTQSKNPICSRSVFKALICEASGFACGSRAGPTGTPSSSITALAAPM